MNKSIPSIYELNDLFFNGQYCISFLFENRVFYNERTCICGEPMTLYRHRNAFRCPKSVCKQEISLKKNSFFFGHKMDCSKILFLGYLWINKTPTTSMVSMSGMSSRTICSFQNYFRQLVTDAMEMEDALIGGEGIIVEVDETKLGKRKYHRGHHVEGVWVLGGVERTAEKKVFLVEVKDRKADLLKHVISKHVRPGSIIYSDLWKGYNRLCEDGTFEHMTVNHSKNFKNPITGVHTNTIEGTWNGLKMQIKPRNRTKEHIDDHLWEFIWRKKNADNLWIGFINALREISYE
jgi:transposase-like protein